MEEKVGRRVEFIGTGGNFLNRIPMAYAFRPRIDNMGPHETGKLI